MSRCGRVLDDRGRVWKEVWQAVAGQEDAKLIHRLFDVNDPESTGIVRIPPEVPDN
jgi:hypothetical protein